MLIIGLLLLLVGYLTGIGILVTLGWILVVVGLVLLLLGAGGYPVAGRPHWW